MKSVSVDDVILLIHAQQDRTLIVPKLVGDNSLRVAIGAAVVLEYIDSVSYHTGSGTALRHCLTKKGFLRFGELTNTTIHFLDEETE